jgi:hypothetical protein
LNGVLIINEKGDIIQRLNKENGLQDDIVKNVGTLTIIMIYGLLLGKGISKAEISSPLNSLNEAQGLNGFIEDIVKVKNTLYVATSLGVYAYINSQFVSVEGINSQTWSLRKFITANDTLLLASSETGLYEINKNTSKFIQAEYGFALHQSKINPNRVYMGMNDGLTSIKYENKRWIYEDYFNGVDYKIKNIEEDEKGNLWLATPVDGLIKVNFNQNLKDTLVTAWNKKYSIQYFDTQMDYHPWIIIFHICIKIKSYLLPTMVFMNLTREKTIILSVLFFKTRIIAVSSLPFRNKRRLNRLDVYCKTRSN